MQKFILSTASAALAAVGVLSALAAAPVSAAQIYPVDQARFMTNAKFDFKIELDKKADRKNVVVEINGADYKKVLKGSEIWVPEEIDSEGSALIMRDVEIKKPGKYTVVVKSPEGEMRADWDLYSTPKKAAAKNVIILLADGLPSDTALQAPHSLPKGRKEWHVSGTRLPWTICRTWRSSARVRLTRSPPTVRIQLRPI